MLFFLSNHLIRAIFLINHTVNESNCLQRSHARKWVHLCRFEFKHDTPSWGCFSDMYFKTCKVSSEETLLVTKKATRCAWSRKKITCTLCISQFHLRPAPPRADPRALASFLPWMANSRGWGLLSCQTPPGWGRKKRANAPSYVNTTTFFIARTVK